MTEELNANVLLVDDEERFLQVFSKRLETRGMKVDTAATGEDAIQRARNRDFDAIVLDLSMPGMSGLEALKKMKAQNPDLQIIILTGHGTLQAGVEAMKSGALDFMEKPVDLNKLLEKIEEAQERKILVLEKKHQKQVEEILLSKSW
jgi:DNA-binding NtrC family response regulator